MTKKDLQNIQAVFKREFLAYFNSPVLYVIIVIFLLTAMGFAFLFGGFLRNGNANLNQAFFFWHPWIYMVLAPAVGMRLWSEEHRLGTVELLMTFPVSPWSAIVGKYLAAALVWMIALALTFPMVWTVCYLGDPDPGPILTGYIASYLYAITCLAVTSAVSAFTRNQVVCFIVSVAVCLLMTLIGFGPVIDWVINWFPASLEGIVRFIGYLSFMDHFYEMTKGILVLRDVLYFISVIAMALLITGRALQAKRA
jgi:ABC-2 type transport system permease protein